MGSVSVTVWSAVTVKLTALNVGAPRPVATVTPLCIPAFERTDVGFALHLVSRHWRRAASTANI
jgi:hypothetical protein